MNNLAELLGDHLDLLTLRYVPSEGLVDQLCLLDIAIYVAGQALEFHLRTKNVRVAFLFILDIISQGHTGQHLSIEGPPQCWFNLDSRNGMCFNTVFQLGLEQQML